MPRCRAKLVPSTRRKYTAEDMGKAVRLVMVDKYDVRRAARQASVPRSTLQDHLNKLRKDGTSMEVSLSKLGRKTALTEVEEKVLANLLNICADWGFSFSMTDICNLVKQYLDSIPRKVEQFRDNRPGKDWATAFLKIRHPWLSSRFAHNTKSRPDISAELLSSCLSQLCETAGVDPACYAETCFADDSDKVKSTVPRGSPASKVTKKGKSRRKPKLSIPAKKVLKDCEYEIAAERTAPHFRPWARSCSVVLSRLEISRDHSAFKVDEALTYCDRYGLNK